MEQQHDTAAIDVMDEDSSLNERPVQDVPATMLPMAYPYKMPQFYVRECYPMYYHQIMNLLDGTLTNTKMQWITVTGTPGVGKSIFYLYVFKRLRRERSNMTIVTASFNKHRKLEQCFVFRPGEEEPVDFTENMIRTRSMKDAIHLYDGAPEVKPSNCQMIAFSSPNYEWLDSVRKTQYHTELYMPVWTLGELENAAACLDVEIDNNNLRQRFMKYGGIPRICLSTSLRYERKFGREIEEAVEKLKSYADVIQCFEKQMPLDRVVHRLFYYEPILFDEIYCFARLDFGTPWIAVKIEESLLERSNSKRVEYMKMIRGVHEASSLYGWMFEYFAHDTFRQGGSFPMRHLFPEMEEQCAPLIIESGYFETFKSMEKLEREWENLYMTPSNRNYKAVDSFYFAAPNLYVFQITCARHHDVNASGLIKLLYTIGMNDAVLNHRGKLHLVFVVPKGREFVRQKIIFEEYTLSTDLERIPVSDVQGVGSVEHRKLKEMGIDNAAQLFYAVKADIESNGSTFKFMNAIARDFVCAVESRSQWSMLSNIPQRCIELDVNNNAQT